jgi:4,5-DOPA dioxygenase extradiol
LKKHPVLFIGHGSPMNALHDNAFTQVLRKLGKELEKPKAVLCISAHWLTTGTWVTSMKIPKTIHDFYGFPKELGEMQYPAPGSPEIADLIQQGVQSPSVQLDEGAWGLDHGTWSVLTHIYPKADVPVVQLSIDIEKAGEFHFEIGKQLRFLREQGVLIVGSGNLVHNLRKINFNRGAQPFDWAIEFDEWLKIKLINRDYSPLLNEYDQSKMGEMSVPTPEHYFPLLYVLGAVDPKEELIFEYEGIEHSSISMRSFSFGR